MSVFARQLSVAVNGTPRLAAREGAVPGLRPLLEAPAEDPLPAPSGSWQSLGPCG